MAKRGRPTVAAQSVDEAIHRVLSWHPPLRWTRPRNEFERQAQARTGGRKVNPQSKTGQAARLAVYLVNTEGIDLSQAARRAAKAWPVNADNVRKYARKLIAGPTVVVQFNGAAWMPHAPKRVALLAESREATAADFQPV